MFHVIQTQTFKVKPAITESLFTVYLDLFVADDSQFKYLQTKYLYQRKKYFQLHEFHYK